ncbi:MAG: membrane protein insertion efficiency factor YidD [Clostridia bacterium]
MKYLCIALIKLYKATLSKLLGRRCIYTPSCSVYGMEAYLEHGTIKGTYLTAKRLARCAPWGKGGFDPIPYNLKGKIKWSL